MNQICFRRRAARAVRMALAALAASVPLLYGAAAQAADLKLACNGTQARLVFSTDEEWQMNGAETGYGWGAPHATLDENEYYADWEKGIATADLPAGKWLTPGNLTAKPSYDTPVDRSYQFRRKIHVDRLVRLNSIRLEQAGSKYLADNTLEKLAVSPDDPAGQYTSLEAGSYPGGFRDNVAQFARSDIKGVWKEGANYLVMQVHNSEDKHTIAHPQGVRAQFTLTATCVLPPEKEVLACGSGNTAELEFQTGAGWEVYGESTNGAWKNAFVARDTTERAASAYDPTADEGEWISPGSRSGTVPTIDAYHFRRKIVLDPRIDLATMQLDSAGTKYAADDYLNSVMVTQDGATIPDTAGRVQSGRGNISLYDALEAGIDQTAGKWAAGDNYLVWKVSNKQDAHDTRGQPLTLLANVKITAQCAPQKLELTCGADNKAELEFFTDGSWQVTGPYTGRAWQDVFIAWDKSEGFAALYRPDGNDGWTGAWISPASRKIVADVATDVEAYHFRQKITLDPRIIPASVTLAGTLVSVDDVINYVGATQGDDRLGGVAKDMTLASRRALYPRTTALVALSGDGDADEKNWAPGADNWLVWKVTNQQERHNDHADVEGIRHGQIGMYAQVKISADCEAPGPTCTPEQQAATECKGGQDPDKDCCHAPSSTCTDEQRAATECTGSQKPETDCCHVPTPPGPCPTDKNLLPVCDPGQVPAVDCCKPLDPTCTVEELAQYCCDVTRSECCIPCDPSKKENTTCEDDQNPDLFCCTCKKPYEQRPICKAGQVPAGINKSGTKAAEVVCCRLEPATSTPVPVNNPWALGLLGAAVAAAAAARRRRSTRRDDDA